MPTHLLREIRTSASERFDTDAQVFKKTCTTEYITDCGCMFTNTTSMHYVNITVPVWPDDGCVICKETWQRFQVMFDALREKR